MEPIALKCTKCDTEWKLFKVGTDAVLCPKCQEPVLLPADVVLPSPSIAPPSVSETPPTEAPAPIAPPDVPPIPEPPPVPPRRPFREPISRNDDDRDYGEPDELEVAPRRSGMHPLIVVLIVLLLLFVLTPLAIIVLFWALCALSV